MANILDFAVNLSLLTSGNFDSSLSPSIKRLQELQKNTENLQKVSGQTEKFAKMQQSITQSQTTMLEMSKAARNLNADIAANQVRTAQLQGRYEVFRAAQQRLIASGQKNTETYRHVTERMKTLQVQIKGNQAEGKRLEDQQKKLETGAQKLQTGLDRDRESLMNLRTALNDAGVNTGKLASEQDRLQKELEQSQAAQKRLSDAQSKYESIKGQLSWGNMKGDILTSAGALMAFKEPISVMMNFEQAMAQVKAVTGANDTDFMMLHSQARELGASTQFSATQAANTQENLARAGLTPQQIHDILPSVLAMAASDGMELAQAGDILAGSIRGYGLDPQEGARVADMLAYISSNSQTNVANAGAAFQAISGTGQLMGIEAERMGAYIGVLANRGIQGAEAATAIERSLQALAAPTTEAQKTLQKFGVATKTKGGGLRFIDDIAVELLDKTAKLGSTGQMEAFKDVFGKAYAGTMQKMALGVKSGDMNAMYSGLKNDKQGSAQRMADIRNNTLQGDLTSLSSAWEGFMISVGKPLEEWSRNIIQWLTEGIQKVTAFMNEHKTLADIVVKIAAGFAGYKVLSTAWKYGSLLTQLPFAKLSVIMAEGAAQTAATGKSFSLIGTLASKAWGIIAAHPFIAIGAAVSAAAILIYQNWDTIKEVAAKCWQAVKDFAGEAAQWISGKWQAVSDWWDSWTLADVFAPVSDMALRAFSYLIEPFSSLSSWLSDTFKMPDIFAGLSDMASSALDYIKGLFSAFGDWIMNTIGKLNPFNWDLPEWLGGSKEQRAATRAESAKKMASWDPLSGNLPGFAVGGIITRHAAVQVAENGPEAIIPLTDKSRGTELLMQAAQALGVDIIPEGMKQVSYNALNDERAVSSNSSALSSLVQNTGGNALSSLVQNTGGSALSSLVQNTGGNALSSLVQNTGGNALSSLVQDNTNQQTASIIDLSESIRRNDSNDSYNQERNYGDNSRAGYNNLSGQPQINITVYSNGNDDNTGLAEMIAQKFREAWQELQERQERLAYA